MKYNAKSSPILIRFLILLAFALCELSALAATTTWTGNGRSTSWFEAGNWNNGVPNLSTDAIINNGSEARINGGSAAAHSLTLGLSAQDSGTVKVIGGSLTLPPTAPLNASFPVEGTIYVGYQGRGTLNISNGGTVSCGYGYIAASGTGSNGTVTVDGIGSSWTLTGDGNSRKLYVGGGAIAFTDGGTALLSITNGGHVTVINPDNNYAAWVGASGTLTGNGTLTATGSSINARLVVVAGTLAPAKSLTIDGNLGFNPGSTMVCNVTPQDINNIYVPVAGTAFLNGGSVEVNMTGTGFTTGTRFTLLHAGDGLYPNSTFQGGETINVPWCPWCQPLFTPVIEYDYAAHNVNLYLSP
jgi:T5SS/PEP-CTERM-associated repeat protein